MIKKLFLVTLIGISLNLNSLDFTIPFLPKTIKAADLDLDGDNDLVIGHLMNIDNNFQVTICVNDGLGSFSILQNFDLFAGAYILDIANFDNNPILDIVISNQDGNEGEQRVCIIYNLDFENLCFEGLDFVDSPARYGTSGDFNNDNLTDLALTTHGVASESYWIILYGNGNQEFDEPQIHETPDNITFYNIICKDFDNNNYDDFTVLGSSSYVFYGTPDGFDSVELGSGHTNASLNAGDMDNDGDDDIVISKLVGMTALNLFKYENIDYEYFNESIQFITYPWGYHYSADFNNDLLIDLISFGREEYTIYWNIGDFNFSYPVEYAIPYYGESSSKAAFADFDGNNTIDMALIRYDLYENNLSILFNDSTGAMFEDPFTEAEQSYLIPQITDLRNYPNPFNPTTRIEYDLNENLQNPVLLVFNITGQIVDKISINKDQNSYIWDASNNPSGVYLYQIKAANFESEINKMVLMK